MADFGSDEATLGVRSWAPHGFFNRPSRHAVHSHYLVLNAQVRERQSGKREFKGTIGVIGEKAFLMNLLLQQSLLDRSCLAQDFQKVFRRWRLRERGRSGVDGDPRLFADGPYVRDRLQEIAGG